MLKHSGILGPNIQEGDVAEIVILGRIMRWVSADTPRPEWEADPRHAEVIWDQFGFRGDSKGLATLD